MLWESERTRADTYISLAMEVQGLWNEDRATACFLCLLSSSSKGRSPSPIIIPYPFVN